MRVSGTAARFLTKEQRTAMVRDFWKPAGKSEKLAFKDKRHLGYRATRIESGGKQIFNSPVQDDYAIDKIHKFSFIEHIRKTLADWNKFPENHPMRKRKFRVLDLGAGTCAYARQLREEFGNRVKVFTTGLSKAPAQGLLRKALGDHTAKLDKNDLNFRSVRELRDFPEFDLVIDTFGECCYINEGHANAYLPQRNLYDDLENYFTAVISKLKPGGIASIHFALPKPYTEDFISNLQDELGGFKILDLIARSGKTIIRLQKHELEKDTKVNA